MKRTININSHGEEIELEALKYKIYILGGWGVNLGKFSISFKKVATEEIFKCEKAYWPIQTYAFEKKARRIFVMNVQEAGTYEILFNNPQSLKVKQSTSLIPSLFSSALSTKDLEIIISEKLGF